MNSNSVKNKIILAVGLVVMTGVVTALCFLATGREVSSAEMTLTVMMLMLTAAIAIMCATLGRSVKKTLYSYANIGLIGGILFGAVLLTVIVERFVFCLTADDFSLTAVYRAVISFPRRFSYYAVFVMSAVCIALGVSNVALIRNEGFRPHNALSVLVAALYIGGTAAVYGAADFLEKNVFLSENVFFSVLNVTVSSFILLVLCYFECIFAGAAVLGFIAARRKPALDKDYIIILGCSIDKKGGLLPLLKGRVNRAIRFAWEQEIATGKPMKYVPSGGQGPNEVMSEGSAMELYLMSRGAESYEIFPEKESATTWENMVFSKKVIDGLKPDAKVAFATTNYHILRSGILARRAGLDAEGIAGDTKWYFWPNGFIREFFAILTMNVKAHVFTAAALSVICTAISCVGYFGGYI